MTRSEFLLSDAMKTQNDLLLDAASFLAGLFFILAFAPFGQSYLAIAALAVLFYTWQSAGPQRAAIRGCLFGLAQFGFGVSWVYVSIHDFGGANILVASLLTLLFCGFWALFPGLAGYLVGKLSPRRTGGWVYLTMPCIWILCEYLRGEWIFDGFPWLLTGYSQLDTPLAGYVPVLGSYSTGFIAALTAAMTLLLVDRRDALSVLAVFVVACLWLTGWTLQGISWSRPIGKTISVAMIQGNIDQDKKWQPENRDRILETYRQLTEQHWQAQIIIWPETAVPAFYDEVSKNFLQPLADKAKKNHTDLIISVPVRDHDKKEYYNAVLTLGTTQGFYKKVHLLPFGEYLPLQPLSGFLLQTLDIPLGSFTAGNRKQPMLKAAGYPFIASICYEDAFGIYGAGNFTDAAFLINVTNDAWFGDSLEPHQHMQIARMRALESGRYLLRATNSGVTAVVAPNGRIISRAPLFTTTVLTSSFHPMGGATPFMVSGDWPIILLCSLCLSMVIVIPAAKNQR